MTRAQPPLVCIRARSIKMGVVLIKWAWPQNFSRALILQPHHCNNPRSASGLGGSESTGLRVKFRQKKSTGGHLDLQIQGQFQLRLWAGTESYNT